MKKVVFLACISSLVFACQGNEQKHEASGSGKISYSAETFASENDPICKMSIKEGAADTALVNGKVYGFCSVPCKEEFKKDPAKHL